MTGSMLITNDQGKGIFLVISHSSSGTTPVAIATSSEDSTVENVLQMARAELKRQKANPTVSSGNVKFLEEWIRVFLITPPAPVVILTSPDKTSVRLTGEPWEKDKFLKHKGENINASA